MAARRWDKRPTNKRPTVQKAYNTKRPSGQKAYNDKITTGQKTHKRKDLKGQNLLNVPKFDKSNFHYLIVHIKDFSEQQ